MNVLTPTSLTTSVVDIILCMWLKFVLFPVISAPSEQVCLGGEQQCWPSEHAASRQEEVQVRESGRKDGLYSI